MAGMTAPNPLLVPWTTPFGIPPFDRILPEHFPPAFEAAMAEHLEEIAAIGADPAGKQRSGQTGVSNADVLRTHGFIVRDRTIGFHEGLNLVRRRLAPADASPPRLLIHERCRKLIEALERYHFPEDQPESLTPVKDGTDHAADALRYLIAGHDHSNKAKLTRWA